MIRRAFYSFHYKPDSWRASKVRNMGVIGGNKPALDNDWETVKKGGAPAIKKWIDTQLSGKSVAIVLIGSNTANRKWIQYEIKKAWNDGRSVLGIHIHNLSDSFGDRTAKGRNPFDNLEIGSKSMSTIVKVYNPPSTMSTVVYGYIKRNLGGWIETAIRIRGKYD